MTISEFRRLDTTYRVEKPGLFCLCKPDNVASIEQIRKVEHSIGAFLPNGYCEFLHEFEGGCFGLLTVFSADPTGKWYLPTKFREASEFLPKGLIPISDDFSGGYYALQLSNGSASDQVHYWNVDGGTTGAGFDTVLDFIARYAYEPA